MRSEIELSKKMLKDSIISGEIDNISYIDLVNINTYINQIEQSLLMAEIDRDKFETISEAFSYMILKEGI